MTDDLHAMADWLLACGVDTVALESTGVYWIPVFEVLEQRGLKVFLVDARQMKYVPGRKSDVQDCQWLQKLMSLGFLRAAFRPTDEIGEHPIILLLAHCHRLLQDSQRTAAPGESSNSTRVSQTGCTSLCSPLSPTIPGPGS